MVLDRFERDLDIGADSAEMVGRFCWTLPADARWVRCHLYQGSETRAFNAYDLSFHDPGRPSLGQRLYARIGDRLLGRE
jgi:hypothetical protein